MRLAFRGLGCRGFWGVMGVMALAGLRVDVVLGV